MLLILIQEDSDNERLFTAMMVIYIRSLDNVELSVSYEKHFVKLSNTIRGRYLMTGESGMKPDRQLNLPVIPTVVAPAANENNALHSITAKSNTNKKSSIVRPKITRAPDTSDSNISTTAPFVNTTTTSGTATNTGSSATTGIKSSTSATTNIIPNPKVIKSDPKAVTTAIATNLVTKTAIEDNSNTKKAFDTTPANDDKDNVKISHDNDKKKEKKEKSKKEKKGTKTTNILGGMLLLLCLLILIIVIITNRIGAYKVCITKGY